MMGLRRIWAVMEKEFLHIVRDNVVFTIAFIAPLFLALLLGFIYVNHQVVDIPVVVYDQDQSDISRTMISAFKDSPKLKIVKYAENYEELEKEISNQNCYMGIIIPQDLKKNIKSGRSAEVMVILNGTNMLLMNTVVNAANQVVQTISAGITIKRMEGYGISHKSALQAVTSINFRTRTWYNPTTSYEIFMLIGLLGTTLQQFALLTIALSMSKEKEKGTWRNIVMSKLKTYEVIIGKFLVYFMIFLFNSILMYGIAIEFFKIPMRGNSLTLLGTTALFIFVALLFGLALSTILKSQVQAIEASMIIALPSFLLSGFTWPATSMPDFLQVVSACLPLTYFLKAIRSEMLIGMDWWGVRADIASLVIFALILIPLIFFWGDISRYKTKAYKLADAGNLTP